MHGVTTPLLLPREKLGTLSRDNRERVSHALCSGYPCGTTTHEKSKNGKQGNGKEKTTHSFLYSLTSGFEQICDQLKLLDIIHILQIFS